MNLISKMLLLIGLLMAPVIVLFIYANHQSVQVVRSQIHVANETRLERFIAETEAKMDHIAGLSNLMTRDPDFIEFASNSFRSNRYEYASLLASIERKLGLFSLAADRMSRINAYFPKSGHAASSYVSGFAYRENDLAKASAAEWTLRTVSDNGVAKRAFTRYFVEPPSAMTDLRQAAIVLEVDLMEDNLIVLLNEFKTKGNNDPFLYKDNGSYIFNSSVNREMAEFVSQSIRTGPPPYENHYDIVRVKGKEYLVYFYPSTKLGWTLYDYVPLQDILSPVTRSQRLFYSTVGVLLLVGAAAALMIYWNVQVPIRSLITSISSLRHGTYSVRIQRKHNREFRLLIDQFNGMAAQIQHLIEKVHVEEIRSKEAIMKQLQSQINPHFLYNSLAYIVSMGKMNRSQAVVSMAYNLADYFQYTARNNSMLTTVGEEIRFVTSYMEIMNDQLDRIHYELDLPPLIEKLAIPRLLIQPIVENAIVHGLESIQEAGRIRITASNTEDRIAIIVEDNGIGLSKERRTAMLERMGAPLTEDEHFGLWNVNQRLKYHFGPEAQMMLEDSELGGLKVALLWHTKPIQRTDAS